MAMKPGSFAWYDLTTTDTKAAAAFYGSVIGWEAKEAGVGDRPYLIFSMGAANVAGLAPISAEAAAKDATPGWTGYILVDDVDTYASQVKTAGGFILHGPEDIPGVLRFALVADPHGATFVVFKGMMQASSPAVLAPEAPGNIGWNELMAGDEERDFAFYASIFGWRQERLVAMGALGNYRVFSSGGAPCGGMMTKTAATPAPYWLYYFNVDAVDAAVKRVVKGGGKVTQDTRQVPTQQWIAQCTDPQGARFALISAKR